MILGMLGNVITGGALKMGANLLNGWMETRHLHKMAIVNADNERIKMLQDGKAKPDNFTKHTRRFLAMLMLSVFCYVVLHHVVFQPDLSYRILIPSDPGFFQGWFGATAQEETITVSAGSLLWRYFNLIEVIVGFYFVPSKR